jgi:hypothetical protein
MAAPTATLQGKLTEGQACGAGPGGWGLGSGPGVASGLVALVEGGQRPRNQGQTAARRAVSKAS